MNEPNHLILQDQIPFSTLEPTGLDVRARARGGTRDTKEARSIISMRRRLRTRPLNKKNHHPQIAPKIVLLSQSNRYLNGKSMATNQRTYLRLPKTNYPLNGIAFHKAYLEARGVHACLPKSTAARLASVEMRMYDHRPVGMCVTSSTVDIVLDDFTVVTYTFSEGSPLSTGVLVGELSDVFVSDTKIKEQRQGAVTAAFITPKVLIGALKGGRSAVGIWNANRDVSSRKSASFLPQGILRNASLAIYQRPNEETSGGPPGRWGSAVYQHDMDMGMDMGMQMGTGAGNPLSKRKTQQMGMRMRMGMGMRNSLDSKYGPGSGPILRRGEATTPGVGVGVGRGVDLDVDVERDGVGGGVSYPREQAQLIVSNELKSLFLILFYHRLVAMEFDRSTMPCKTFPTGEGALNVCGTLHFPPNKRLFWAAFDDNMTSEKEEGEGSLDVKESRFDSGKADKPAAGGYVNKADMEGGSSRRSDPSSIPLIVCYEHATDFEQRIYVQRATLRMPMTSHTAGQRGSIVLNKAKDRPSNKQPANKSSNTYRSECLSESRPAPAPPPQPECERECDSRHVNFWRFPIDAMTHTQGRPTLTAVGYHPKPNRLLLALDTGLLIMVSVGVAFASTPSSTSNSPSDSNKIREVGRVSTGHAHQAKMVKWHPEGSWFVCLYTSGEIRAFDWSLTPLRFASPYGTTLSLNPKLDSPPVLANWKPLNPDTKAHAYHTPSFENWELCVVHASGPVYLLRILRGTRLEARVGDPMYVLRQRLNNREYDEGERSLLLLKDESSLLDCLTLLVNHLLDDNPYQPHKTVQCNAITSENSSHKHNTCFHDHLANHNCGKHRLHQQHRHQHLRQVVDEHHNRDPQHALRLFRILHAHWPRFKSVDATYHEAGSDLFCQLITRACALTRYDLAYSIARLMSNSRGFSSLRGWIALDKSAPAFLRKLVEAKTAMDPSTFEAELSKN
ncbi:hypothetical protein AAMO2058_001669000 [Amorphochlora amoebiformis]